MIRNWSTIAMRLFMRTGLIATVLGAAMNLQAQSSLIRGPVLGFVTDVAGAEIRPILGVPGASMLGGVLRLDTKIRRAVISSTQNYAIAVRAEDGQVVLINLAASEPAVNAVTQARAGAGLIAISPTGSTAALHSEDSRTVQIIGGLPHAPELIDEFDASALPAHIDRIAVSDDGTIALVRSVNEDRAELWALDALGVKRISGDGLRAAAFFPRSRDAVISEDATRSAFLITEVDRSAARFPLVSAGDGIGAFSSVAVSEDGHHVFLASEETGALVLVDMESRRSALVPCNCRPTGLYPLRGTLIFRLTEPSRQALTLLDASAGDAHIAIIPPDVTEP